MSGTAWELLFMMLILKLPIAYLCYVVYWAIKAEPDPPEPAVLPAVPVDPERPPSLSARRPTRKPSRGGPHTPPPKRARTAAAR